jgi:hypothetical protein
VAAARQAGVRHVYGTAASQAARNVLAAKLTEMGVPATVLNSTRSSAAPAGQPATRCASTLRRGR